MSAPTSTPTNRHVRGVFDTARLPAASGLQINPGDLVVFHSGLAFAAQNGASWNSGNELQNWSGYRADFAGVSLSQVNSTQVVSGVPQEVTVAVEGIFRYPAPLSSGVTYQPGTFIGMTQFDPINGGGSGVFHPQAVMQCSGQASCIGKIVEPTTCVASGQGQVIIYLRGTNAKGVIAGV